MKSKAEKVQIYEQICRQIAFVYKGYHVERIAKVIIHDIIVRETTWKFRSYGRLFLSKSFRKLNVEPCEVFMTFPVELKTRSDYVEIWEFVKNKIYVKSCFHELKSSIKFKLNLKTIALALKKTKNTGFLSLDQRFKIWVTLTMILNTIDNAEEEIEIKTSKYVSFFSVHWVENLLSQYFKKRKVPTYNLQHGLIFYQIANPLDILQHSAIESDYHLAWGRYTEDSFIEHNIGTPKVLIAGYPKAKLKVGLTKPTHSICVVFLSRADYDHENKALLNILLDYNKRFNQCFTFFLKLHPNLNLRSYQKYLEGIRAGTAFKILEKSMRLQHVFETIEPDFCITVNSTTYYECYLNGYVSLRYHTHAFDRFFGLADDVFTDREEFEVKVNTLYNGFEDGFAERTIKQKLNYVIGCDEDHYSEILN